VMWLSAIYVNTWQETTRWRTKCRAESGKPSDCPSPGTSRTHYLLNQAVADSKRHAAAVAGHRPWYADGGLRWLTQFSTPIESLACLWI